MSLPRKRKSAAARRAEIVETAIRLSAKIGPDRVTTQHLADAVGVTQPAIFRHFATKADIWMAVADYIVDQMEALHAHAELEGTPDYAVLLRQIVTGHLHFITEQPAIPAILFSRELQAENAELRTRFASVMDKRLAGLTAMITKAQSEGQLRDTIAPEDMAHLLLATIQGLSMRWLVSDHAFDLPEEGGRVLGQLIDSLRV